jgi:hypothetical protein
VYFHRSSRILSGVADELSHPDLRLAEWMQEKYVRSDFINQALATPRSDIFIEPPAALVCLTLPRQSLKTFEDRVNMGDGRRSLIDAAHRCVRRCLIESFRLGEGFVPGTIWLLAWFSVRVENLRSNAVPIES